MHPGTSSEAGQPGNKDAPYITNGGRREYKEWFKARVVEECHAPGASVSIVARRYDINTNVLFRWRREYQLGILKPSPRSDLQETFVPVGVIDQDGKLVPETQQAPAAPAIEGKVKAL